MSLIRFEPWSIADAVQRDLDRLTGRRVGINGDQPPAIDWTPAIDIVEEKARFVLRADLPGVDPADIDLSAEDGYLIISGERKAEDRSEVDGIERYERVSGRFLRRFALPDTADAEAISARSNHGLLEISIPKLPETQPRRITVDAA
jgi:HSP20 family protein